MKQPTVPAEDATIEQELWAGDQANTKHEERAARELYRRRLRITELEARLRRSWQPIETKPPAREQSGIIVSDGVRRWFDHPVMREALGNWLDDEPAPKWWFELPPLPNAAKP